MRYPDVASFWSQATESRTEAPIFLNHNHWIPLEHIQQHVGHLARLGYHQIMPCVDLKIAVVLQLPRAIRIATVAQRCRTINICARDAECSVAIHEAKPLLK